MKTATNVTIACAIAVLSVPTLASAERSKDFSSATKLSAAQEVQNSPVVSKGRSKAIIRFARDFSSAEIRVNFNRLEGQVTRLHLHCNIAGTNGPIAIGLIDVIAPANDNSDVITFEGHRIFGTITNAEFPTEDPCPGFVNRPVNNIVSLAAAIEAGLIYWNLHTDAFPAGELRGQVRPLIATEDDD
ncbi:MAG: CHRD domain-containing protein [Woeseiaceae bacterium]|nr:CHRD domain-containing protein [Woeseiaceae bacterium]